MGHGPSRKPVLLGGRGPESGPPGAMGRWSATPRDLATLALTRTTWQRPSGCNLKPMTAVISAAAASFHSPRPSEGAAVSESPRVRACVRDRGSDSAWAQCVPPQPDSKANPECQPKRKVKWSDLLSALDSLYRGCAASEFRYFQRSK